MMIRALFGVVGIINSDGEAQELLSIARSLIDAGSMGSGSGLEQAEDRLRDVLSWIGRWL